jgi:hypothetical protein
MVTERKLARRTIIMPTKINEPFLLKSTINNDIPKENNHIGSWKNEQIAQCTNSSIPNNSILTQDLYSASYKFFLTEKLKSLASLQHSTFDETTNTLLKKKSSIPSQTRRFIIDIGHHQLHEQNFCNRTCIKNLQEDHRSFHSMISTHYKWCFAAEEASYIDKILENNTNLQHCVIYNRYFRPKVRNNTDIVEPVYYVAAAATFLIAKSSSTLLYLGVSNDTFARSDKITDVYVAQKRQGKHSKNYYKGHNLGSYLLCLIQKITFCVTQNYSIVTQVKNHQTNGAVYFYLKHYFFIANSNHYYINETKLLYADAFQSNSNGLVYMISRCPIYIIYPNYLLNKDEIELLEEPINQGIKFILRKNDRKQLQSTSDIKNSFNEVQEFFFKQNNQNTIIINNQDTKLFCNEERQVENESVFVGNDLLWDNYMNVNNYSVLKIHSDNHPRNNYYYRLMAILLFNSEQRYLDMRCFFYYLFQCISFLNELKCDLFDPNPKLHKIKKNRNSLIKQFQKDVCNSIQICNNLNGDEILTKFNLPNNNDNFNKIFTKNDYNAAILLLKEQQLNTLYPGSNLELSLFSSIFGFNFTEYEQLSKSKQDINDKNE